MDGPIKNEKNNYDIFSQLRKKIEEKLILTRTFSNDGTLLKDELF